MVIEYYFIQGRQSARRPLHEDVLGNKWFYHLIVNPAHFPLAIHFSYSLREVEFSAAHIFSNKARTNRNEIRL